MLNIRYWRSDYLKTIFNDINYDSQRGGAVSDFCIGYAYSEDPEQFRIDIATIFADELIGYFFLSKDQEKPPKELKQVDEPGVFYFDIAEDKESPGADALIDMYDYVEELEMNLPHSGKQRLLILTRVLQKLYDLKHVKELAVATTTGDFLTDVIEFPDKSSIKDTIFAASECYYENWPYEKYFLWKK